MKTWKAHIRIIGLMIGLAGGFIHSLAAEDRVIVVSPATELNANFDLAAVAEVFKESENLRDFEHALNDPAIFLNNLDLNGDGQVDFIRVLEEEQEEGRLIVLQAIMGENAYADIAYIDIAQEENGDYQVQIRGETSLYGENYYYIPESRSISSWPIIVTLYDPFYDFYDSSYSWNHYPAWWSSYSCIRVGLYRAQVIYRYPFRSFRRSYHPYFRYYNYHHPSHRDYKPIRYPHRRYSWDYWDHDRRNHDYYDKRKWRDRDKDNDRWKKRDRDKDRSDRDWNRKDFRNDRKRDATYEKSRRVDPPRKDRSEYNRPNYVRPRSPEWRQKSRDGRKIEMPAVNSPSYRESRKKVHTLKSPKSYTPPKISSPTRRIETSRPLSVSKPTPLTNIKERRSSSFPSRSEKRVKPDRPKPNREK